MGWHPSTSSWDRFGTAGKTWMHLSQTNCQSDKDTITIVSQPTDPHMLEDQLIIRLMAMKVCRRRLSKELLHLPCEALRGTCACLEPRIRSSNQQPCTVLIFQAV